MLEVGEKHRLSAEIEEVLFSQTSASVGLIIVNTEGDVDGDVGSIRIDE